MQLSRTSLHIPPAAGRLEIAATFQNDIAEAAVHVYIVGQLPNTAHQVLKPIWVDTLGIFSYWMQLSVSQVAPAGVNPF
jgi:hypothetical protein